MKKTTFPPPGDLPTDPTNSAGLGLIEEIVQAAGGIASLLINVLKKPPADTWSTFTNYDKSRYVKEALQIATTAALSDNSYSVANTFRKFISRVSLNTNWSKWETKNPRFFVSLLAAEDEVKLYRKSGYQPGMQYVNPRIINRVLHPINTTAKASMFSGNSSIIMILVAMGGVAYLIKRKKLNNLINE